MVSRGRVVLRGARSAAEGLEGFESQGRASGSLTTPPSARLGSLILHPPPALDGLKLGGFPGVTTKDHRPRSAANPSWRPRDW